MSLKDKILALIEARVDSADVQGTPEGLADAIMAAFEAPDIEFSWKALDASDDVTEKLITVNSDRHGCTVAIEGSEDGITIDFANGELRVFKHDAFGEIYEDRLGEIKLRDTNDDVELSDGGCIEVPDDDGTIRRRDSHGNCEEIRRIEDEDWQEWADLFNKTKADYTDEDDD